MPNPEFVYTNYIQTTPEQIWKALTQPAFTQRYWGVTFTSDWQTGSTYTLEHNGVTITNPDAGGSRIRAVSPAGVHLAHVYTGVGEGLWSRRRLAGEVVE